MNMSIEELNDLLTNNPELRKKNKALAVSLGIEKQDIAASEKRTDQPGEGERRRPKYRNKKVFVYEDGEVSAGEQIGGHGKVVEHYDSVKEYRRYQDLKLLEKAGVISDLHRQVEFVIQDSFIYKGEKISKISYVADHVYKRNGEQVVEDVKGVAKDGTTITSTKDFKLKWKLLKAKYPEHTFEIF